MTSQTLTVESLEDLQNFALNFSRDLPEKAIVLLRGPMGVGKTQFSKFLAQALGSDETVSPSYSLHNSYSTSRGSLDHLDLYRLESADDLESTGFWDLFDQVEGVVLIEWSERLEEFGLMSGLPRSWPKISVDIGFSKKSDFARDVRVETR